ACSIRGATANTITPASSSASAVQARIATSRDLITSSPRVAVAARLLHRQRALLRARPAVLRRLARLRERGPVALCDVLVVEDEVEQEHAVDVGAAQVETRAHHADLVAYLQAVAAGEEVGLLAVAGQGVGERVVDDDRLAAAVEQALAAVQLRREQQPLVLA